MAVPRLIACHNNAMIPKPIGAIEKSDIDVLVASGRVEDRTIDYKSDLPGPTDDDRREFLRDVSSFANALGGDLVYGITENAGVPLDAPGVALTNFDELRLRLQSSVESNLDPRLPRLDVVHVSGFEKGSVVVVRVPQSWRAPHMITYKGLGKFYVRGNGNRHEMDVVELRSAFAAGEEQAERIRRFRADRFLYVLGGSSPVREFGGPLLIVHVLPLHPGPEPLLDLEAIRANWGLLNREDGNVFELVSRASERPNLDGLLLFSPWEAEALSLSRSYVQVFRKGGIEFVQSQSHPEGDRYVAAPWIDGNETESRILNLVRNARSFFEAVGIPTPFVVSVAFLRAYDLGVVTGSGWYREPKKFDREMLVLPEIIIDDPVRGTADVLRPVLDAFWQSAGYASSPNYSEDGSRRSPRR
jgi:hypothetical protein